jgi:hypothetical protein
MHFATRLPSALPGPANLARRRLAADLATTAANEDARPDRERAPHPRGKRKQMAPRTRPQGIKVECPPEVREGIEEALRGDTIALSDEEAERYFETGELPARVWQWLDESSSRRAT